MVHPPKKLKERGDPGETEAVNLERYGETEAVNGSLSFDMERPKLIKIMKNQLHMTSSGKKHDQATGRSPRS